MPTQVKVRSISGREEKRVVRVCLLASHVGTSEASIISAALC